MTYSTMVQTAESVVLTYSTMSQTVETVALTYSTTLQTAETVALYYSTTRLQIVETVALTYSSTVETSETVAMTCNNNATNCSSDLRNCCTNCSSDLQNCGTNCSSDQQYYATNCSIDLQYYGTNCRNCSIFTMLQIVEAVAREIVNDKNTFLHGDCPDPGCNCCLQGTACLGAVFLHSVLQITQKVKIRGWGFKSGECGAHSMSYLLLMSRSSNRCLGHNRVLLEV